jgi:8-oxo-dGTP diphosphatase
MESIQFGETIKDPLLRLSAYAVILNEKKEILVVDANGTYYLPGGGIDEGENEIEALKREAIEETGYQIHDFEYIGKANQFIPKASLGPMNKLGTFYKAKAGKHDPSLRVEMDHIPEWVTYDEIKKLNMPEFLKWAISQVFE